MQVKLLTTPEQISDMEHNAAYAMLICHANADKLKDETPRSFIEKAIKAGHDSILEHITLTYEVKTLSRACLQELARHRHISLSVESTRHTLRKRVFDYDWVDYITQIINDDLRGPFLADIDLFKAIFNGTSTSNDDTKKFLREYWPTNLVLTANVRELRHIVKLRTNPAALPEFQELAINLVEELPERYKYFLADCVYNNEKND